jgi:hypothetical protein
MLISIEEKKNEQENGTGQVLFQIHKDRELRRWLDVLLVKLQLLVLFFDLWSEKLKDFDCECCCLGSSLEAK